MGEEMGDDERIISIDTIRDELERFLVAKGYISDTYDVATLAAFSPGIADYIERRLLGLLVLLDAMLDACLIFESIDPISSSKFVYFDLFVAQESIDMATGNITIEKATTKNGYYIRRKDKRGS